MIILRLVMMMRLMVLVIISYLVIAMEVSGVVGAPFQTIVLPHDIAKAAGGNIEFGGNIIDRL